MEYIQIPIPDATIFEIPKKKAAFFCYDKFAFNTDSSTLKRNVYEIEHQISSNFKNKNSKLIFISQCIIEVNHAKLLHRSNCDIDHEECGVEEGFNEALFHFYEELSELGINVDEDQFTIEDIIKNDEKIDSIVRYIEDYKKTLEGAALFLIAEDLEDLKENLESLKGGSQIIGKKKWFAIVQSTVINLAMKEGMTGVVKAIKPYLFELYNKIPEYLKLLSHVQ